MQPRRLARFLAFDRRRTIAFVSILVGIFALGFFGVSAGIFIPLIGGVFFLAGLFVWYVPGVLFGWTGFFEYHEFGAAPAGVPGYVVMLLFYGAVAVVASWPFAPKRA